MDRREFIATAIHGAIAVHIPVPASGPEEARELLQDWRQKIQDDVFYEIDENTFIRGSILKAYSL